MAAVDYATIVDDIVTAIDNDELPASDGDTLYIDITDEDPAPEVGWYFDETCLTFSEAPPVIPPGDTAPPYPPGGTPPIPGDPGYPEGPEDPGERPPAIVVVDLVSFHANADALFTVAACPAALTEIDQRLRTPYIASRSCGARMQAHVDTPVDGAELVLCFFDGADWVPCSLYAGGPFVDLSAAGTFAGDFLNLVAEAQADVLFSPHTRNGDDTTDLVLGNISALFVNRVDEGACEDFGEEPPVTECAIPAALAMVNIGVSPFGADLTELTAYLSASPWADDHVFEFNADTYFDTGRTFNGAPALAGYTIVSGTPDRLLRSHFELYALSTMDGYDIPSGTLPDATAFAVIEMEAGADIRDTAGAAFADPTGADNGSGLAIMDFQFSKGLFVRNQNLYLDWGAEGSGSDACFDLGLFDDLIGGQGKRAITLRAIRESTTTVRLLVYINAPCTTPVEIANEVITVGTDESDVYVAELFNTYYTTDAGLPTSVWMWQFALDGDATLFGLAA